MNTLFGKLETPRKGHINNLKDIDENLSIYRSICISQAMLVYLVLLDGKYSRLGCSPANDVLIGDGVPAAG